jgi:hypothetical protein
VKFDARAGVKSVGFVLSILATAGGYVGLIFASVALAKWSLPAVFAAWVVVILLGAFILGGLKPGARS